MSNNETPLILLGYEVESRAMRTFTSTVVLCAALLLSGEARATASFANRSLGLGFGGFSLLPSGADVVSWGLPITLEGGYYIENGFDLYLHVPLMLLSQKVGFGPDKSSPGIIVATGGQFGVRYLFMEESIRPYVMLHLAGLYFFRDAALGNNFYAGPGVGAGIDFFVADSISLGVRGTFDLFITLNAPILFSLGGAANVTTYF
jgi:outer membrane protein